MFHIETGAPTNPEQPVVPGVTRIVDSVIETKLDILSHSLYASLSDIIRLRTFMQSHVFAVLDFMWLLKRLQRDLTSVDLYWRPVGDPQTRRFINEIVMGEECDVIDGVTTSHFEYYVEAMADLGASTESVWAFVGALDRRVPVAKAIEMAGVPAPAAAFVSHTASFLDEAATHEVAAAFAFGREKLIPEMFTALRSIEVTDGADIDRLMTYLIRHIDLDGDEHGPLAFAMVTALCGRDEQLWQEAQDAALRAVQARAQLWTDIENSWSN